MSRIANLIAGFDLLVGKKLIDGYTSMSPDRVGPWLVQVDGTQHYLDNSAALAFIAGALAAASRLRP